MINHVVLLVKQTKKFKKRIVFLAVFIANIGIALALVIPPNSSDFYYEIGGGQDVPLPAFYNKSYLPINAEANIGLGMNCGAFNPQLSLANSLNQIASSGVAMRNKVISSAQAAITELPLYTVSRADPSLYNLLTNALMGAQKDVELSTKSCEVMQSQIAAGQDPYAHWMSLSMGNQWQQEIGTASLSGAGDINVAKEAVDEDSGRSGVPWVAASNHQSNATQVVTQSVHAGGENQPPIHVIYDTVIAGYSVVQARTGASAGFHDADSQLNAVWPSSTQAAEWVVHVVGDQTITTFNGGEKSSTAGVGLYTEIASSAKELQTKLETLVSGETPPTLENLSAISAAGIAVTPETLQAVQSQSPVMQAVLIQKLAQNLAALQVIDKARLGMRLLQAGSRVPVIYRNAAAQTIITDSHDALKNDIADLMLFLQAKNQLASQLMGTLVQANQSQHAQASALDIPAPSSPLLFDGAVKKN